MKTHVRSNILATLVAVMVVMLFCGTASAAKQLKFYSAYQADSFLVQGLVEMCDKIRERTDGEVDFKVYPGGQLGTYENAIEEVRAGTIDAACTWLTKRYHPKLDLGNLPGLCPTGYDEYELMYLRPESPFSREIAKYAGEVGFVSLGGWVEPLPGVILSNPPKDMKDVKGNEKKARSIRVPAMPAVRDAMSAIGYNTVTMDYAEVFSAIQTGQIDGASNIPIEDAYLTARDMVKCFDMNNIISTPGWLIINKKLWESFTPAQRKVVNDTIAEQLQVTLKAGREIDGKYAELFEQKGVKVITYSKDELIARGAELRKKIWPKYEKVFGKEVLSTLEAYIAQNQRALAGK